MDVLEGRGDAAIRLRSGIGIAHDNLNYATLRTAEILEGLQNVRSLHASPNFTLFSQHNVEQKSKTGNYDTIEIMQSQLFMLKFLSACLASRWKTAQQGEWAADRDLPDANSKPPYEHPSPLDEDCAKYIVSVIAMYLGAMRSPSRPSNTTRLDAMVDGVAIHQSYNWRSESSTTEHTPRSPPSTIPSSGQSEATSPTFVKCKFPLPPGAHQWEMTHISRLNDIAYLRSELTKYIGRIIYLISVSNWESVFEKVSQKLSNLSTEQGADPIDLQFLVHCAFDKVRLVQLLNGLRLSVKHCSHKLIHVPFRYLICACRSILGGTSHRSLAAALRRLELDTELPAGVQPCHQWAASYGRRTRSSFRLVIRPERVRIPERYLACSDDVELYFI